MSDIRVVPKANKIYANEIRYGDMLKVGGLLFEVRMTPMQIHTTHYITFYAMCVEDPYIDGIHFKLMPEVKLSIIRY